MALHSELTLYNVDGGIYFLATMFTLGYEDENKRKPKIPLEIEGADEGATAGLLFPSSQVSIPRNVYYDWRCRNVISP